MLLYNHGQLLTTKQGPHPMMVSGVELGWQLDCLAHFWFYEWYSITILCMVFNHSFMHGIQSWFYGWYSVMVLWVVFHHDFNEWYSITILCMVFHHVITFCFGGFFSFQGPPILAWECTKLWQGWSTSWRWKMVTAVSPVLLPSGIALLCTASDGQNKTQQSETERGPEHLCKTTNKGVN